MQLYLSSFLLGNRASELPSLAPNRTAVVVANALDHTNGEIRNGYATGQIHELTRLGFDAHELDLRGCFNQPEFLTRRLERVGLIWVTGGNSFLLRRAMRQSGLDAYINARRHDDSLVYGGFSAGACVAAPTLLGLDIVDDRGADADGYGAGLVWDGLGLIPYSIAPHFQSPHPESAQVDAMIQYFVEHGMPFVTLRDGDAIVTQVQ